MLCFYMDVFMGMRCDGELPVPSAFHPSSTSTPRMCVTFCALQLSKFSPLRMSCDVWLTAHTTLLHTWSARSTRLVCFHRHMAERKWLLPASQGKQRSTLPPHTEAQGLKVTQLNRHEHSRHSALRWNGMESCLSYNAIQATALAACGGVPVTLSGQETESLFPPPRHVFLTWSPSVSSCSRLVLT